MSEHGSIGLDWADGHHTFRLGLGEWRELEGNRKIGAYGLLLRLIGGGWYVDDIRETIRIGLVGGGMHPNDAVKLVNRYVDQRPWLENVAVAVRIIEPSISGIEGQKPLGEAVAAKEGEPISPPITETVQ